jgi:hypothetical protein
MISIFMISFCSCTDDTLNYTDYIVGTVWTTADNVNQIEFVSSSHGFWKYGQGKITCDYYFKGNNIEFSFDSGNEKNLTGVIDSKNNKITIENYYNKTLVFAKN